MYTSHAIGHMGECKPPKDYIHEASGLISKFLCKKSFGFLVKFTSSFLEVSYATDRRVFQKRKIMKKMSHLRDQNVGVG